MDTTVGPLDAAIAGIVVTFALIAAMWLWLFVWEHISDHLWRRKVRRYAERPDYGFGDETIHDPSGSTVNPHTQNRLEY